MKKKLTDILYSFSLLLFITAFGFQHNPPSGWYQQFLSDIGGRQISDIFFLDSLNGWAVTPYINLDDTAYILKTINGGDSWNIVHTRTGAVGFSRISFLDSAIGFVCGANDVFGYKGLSKSIDGGTTWLQLNVPDPFAQFNDMSVLNEDTIWLASNSTGGGVFRTTNGGQSWVRQLNAGGQNPDNIYFYNKDTGYAAQNVLYKTTNSGENWFQIPGGGFGDMHFINALTGWKCYGPMQKTTDGGMSWENVPLPPKSNSLPLSRIYSFHNINEDTIWGVGSVGVIGSVGKGLINKTTDGGQTWQHQYPDSTVSIFQYYHIQFIEKLIGWAYGISSGIHTVTGGNITSIQQVGSEIPVSFKLHQNYPNPFNPVTIINYEIRSGSEVKLVVYDVSGKLIKVLVSQRQSAGTYQYTFDGSGLSSGVYFYSLSIDGVVVDTKKMVLQK